MSVASTTKLLIIFSQQINCLFWVLKVDSRDSPKMTSLPVETKMEALIINWISWLLFKNILFISFRDLNCLFTSGPLALQEINCLRSIQEINLYIPSWKLMILSIYTDFSILVNGHPKGKRQLVTDVEWSNSRKIGIKSLRRVKIGNIQPEHTSYVIYEDIEGTELKFHYILIFSSSVLF